MIVVFVLGGAGGVPAAEAQAQSTCGKPDAALAHGELDEAQDGYLEILASVPSSPCATRGLKRTTDARNAEKKLCEEGKKLAKSGEAEEARRRYVAALSENVDSECAAEGLAPKDDKSLKDRLDEWSGLIPPLAALLLALFVVVGFVLLLVVTWQSRRPSLSIKPFADGAVETKVGSAVAALVEKQLIDLARLGQRHGDGYQLDFVVANVELLARDESLATAVGGLADVSQLKIVVAVLSLIDRVAGNRSLVAEGELLLEGGEGSGLALALYRDNALHARSAHWTSAPPPKAAGWKCLKKKEQAPTGPEPYYSLAEPAASWVQYEAARSFDSNTGLLTDDPKSFSLLTTGLGQHRLGKIAEAARDYGRALGADPDNVGALVNLALLLARHQAAYEDAIALLTRAAKVLESRYEEPR